MKITDVTAHPVTASWNDDPTFGHYLMSSVMIRISTDGPDEGIGEVTLGYFAPEAVAPLVDRFKPMLVGQDPMQIGRLTNSMCDRTRFWSREGAGRSVISGLELALWDLAGKALGVPVCQLLGGAVRDAVPVYASGGPSLWPIERNEQKVASYAELGYRAAKLSHYFHERLSTADRPLTRPEPVDIPHAHLLDRVREMFDMLRHRFGGDFDFALDGHQNAIAQPIEVSEAIEIAETLAPCRLRFYEEPLPYTDLDGYVELRSRSRIPIAGGECLTGLHGFHPLIDRHGVHLVQPDLGFAGGLIETQRIIHHAEGHHIGAALHTGASFGPVLAASWHLAAATTSVDDAVVVP